MDGLFPKFYPTSIGMNRLMVTYRAFQHNSEVRFPKLWADCRSVSRNSLRSQNFMLESQRNLDNIWNKILM